MSGQLLLLVNGVVWGLIVSLMSVGLNLIYGVLGVINVAHGAFYMLGAVLGWLLAQPLGFWPALLLAPLLVAAVAVVAERLALRPLIDRPVMTILATFGLLLAVQQAVLLTFGSTVQRLSPPFRFSLNLLGVRYPAYWVFVAATSLLVMFALWLALRTTRLGLWVRAVRQNTALAAALGIPVPWVFSLTFAAGAWLAGLAGALTAPLGSVDALQVLNILILSFLVVVVGGAGNVWGAAVVAVAARTAEGLLSAWIQPTEAQLVTLGLLGLLILWRPEGLFGRSGR